MRGISQLRFKTLVKRQPFARATSSAFKVLGGHCAARTVARDVGARQRHNYSIWAYFWDRYFQTLSEGCFKLRT
eukprot:4633623-Pleurochrysis_carterae.AAC.1